MFRRAAYQRHLANTTDRSVCGGDVVFCQTTLTTHVIIAVVVVAVVGDVDDDALGQSTL